MAYPTGLLSRALETVDDQAFGLKVNAVAIRSECANGNVPSSRILDGYIDFKQRRAAIVTAAGVSGIGPYAQSEKNNPTLDIVAEFNNMIATIDAVIAWIETNFPKDGSGFLSAKQFSAGTIIDRLFTPTQTAGFRTQLDGLIAAIV